MVFQMSVSVQCSSEPVITVPEQDPATATAKREVETGQLQSISRSQYPSVV